MSHDGGVYGGETPSTILNRNAMGSAIQARAWASSAHRDFTNFNARFLGALAVAPLLDNQGEPLLAGALYFDTVESAVRVWNGASWQPLSNAIAPNPVVMYEEQHEEITYVLRSPVVASAFLAFVAVAPYVYEAIPLAFAPVFTQLNYI